MVEFVIGAGLLALWASFLLFIIITALSDSIPIGFVAGLIFFTIIFFILIFIDDLKSMDYRCEKANISYEMVMTTAEITGEHTDDVFDTFVKYQECGLEPYDAIKSIAPTLSEEEVFAIMEAAAIKEQLNEKRGQD